MHPEFVLELSRQYQAEAREEAARQRLARGVLRRRRGSESQPERPAEPSGPPQADTPPPDSPESRDKNLLPAE